MIEYNELLSIFVKSVDTARKKMKKENEKENKKSIFLLQIDIHYSVFDIFSYAQR